MDTFVAFREFMEDWKELIENKIYIAGESYAGIYAPFLAMHIHEWNEGVSRSRYFSSSPRTQYRLAGFIIGNGVTDFEYDGPRAYAEALFDNGRINQTIFDEWRSLDCKIWYRDLRYKTNDKRCDEIYILFEQIFKQYNIYNLKQ